jgi:hypothetical protein
VILDRRIFLAGTLATALATGLKSKPHRDIFVDALLACFPLYETARLATASLGGLNRLLHRRTLADHTNRGVTMPNNDTLYSASWLDLTTGPVDLDIPVLGGRYMSIALMSAFTDNVAVLRAPVSGNASLRVHIVGPDWRGEPPDERKLVRMPSVYAWLLARTFVAGPGDLLAAQAAQDRIVFAASNIATSKLRLVPNVPTLPDGETFLRVVNGAMVALDPKDRLMRNLQRYTAIGVGKNWSALNSETQTGWTRALLKLADASIANMQEHTSATNGWNWPNANIGAFGNDLVFRAAVALSGIGALPQTEAIYLRATSDAQGQPIKADRSYRLILPPTAQITGAFWSLSAYRGEPDGRYFFEDNAIHRYAINSAMPDLVHRNDGKIELIIQSSRPEGQSNWLPLPTANPALVLRIYLPTLELMRSRGLIGKLEVETK